MQLKAFHPQSGISLLESLVAIVVMSLGILGILGVQMRTLTDTNTSMRRTQAIRLIEDLSERMRIHPNALIQLEDYVTGWSAGPVTPAGTNCRNVQCNSTQLAAFDILEWKATVQRLLPAGDANVFIASAESAVTEDRRQIGIMIRWRENERITTDDKEDASTYRGAINAGREGGDVTCDEGFTCHLQYIPVSARCAPYFASGVPQFFCPGP